MRTWEDRVALSLRDALAEVRLSARQASANPLGVQPARVNRVRWRLREAEDSLREALAMLHVPTARELKAKDS